MMLTPNLKKIIDEKWDNCWPVSNLRPVAILDLTSYIFFVKKSDDHNLISKNVSSLKSGHFIFIKEIEEFTWTMLRDMDAQSIHQLFTRQFGILDLMHEYGQTDGLYSPYFRTPLLLKPTPKLLLNVIEIINLIESGDTATQCAIIEYLFNKVEKAQKGPLFIPEFISRLMISILEPGANDIICDIATGSGSLLINAAQFIESDLPFKQDLSLRLTGMESNPSQLRMAAMRMMVHGINDPHVKIFTSSEANLNQKQTLFVSNLLQRGNEEYVISEDKTPVSEHEKREIILLNYILKNLHTGSRAVVLVHENFLKNILPAIQDIRKEIVENTNLEGIIHLFPDSKSFSSASILIFNKQEAETTSRVWFCKMEKPKKTRSLNETLKNPEADQVRLSEELSHANIVLDNWKNRKEVSTRNSFFISAYDIKANNYNLNFNDYKLVSEAEPSDISKAEEKIIVATKKESLDHFYERPAPLVKRKRKRKAAPAILLILVLAIAAGWLYLDFSNAKIKFNPFSKAVADSAKAISKMPVHTSAFQQKNEPSDIKKNTVIKEILPAENKAETASADSSKQYTVVNKTWFHYQPDSSKRKTFFLEPRQDLVLVPTAEENGFVYVIYVNKKGQSTRGWLAKKDLEPVD